MTKRPTVELPSSLTVEVWHNVFFRRTRTPSAQADLWCIHGFGESGLSYRAAFDHGITRACNLFVPDLPGFGVSPFSSDTLTVADMAHLLARMIRLHSSTRPVVLLAHSMGSLIAAQLVPRLGEQVALLISVEGNLIREDAFFSGMAARYEDVESYHAAFLEHVFALQARGDAFRRYYASVRFADPRALWSLGRSGLAETGDTLGGDVYRQLPCPTVYYWGDVSTPASTRAYLEQHRLPARLFPGSGHWPMIEQSSHFYDALHQDLATQGVLDA